MATTLELSLAPHVSVERGSEGWQLVGRKGRLTLRQPPAELRAAIDALAAGPTSEGRLAVLAGGHAARLFFHLETAADLGLLRWTVAFEGVPLLSASPVSAHFVRRHGRVDAAVEYQLSRFAYLRVEGGGMVLENPRSHVAVAVHDGRAAALLHALSRPISLPAAAGQVQGLDAEALRALFQLLAFADMLSPGLVASQDAEELALAQWEFHDLLFHVRSSSLRHEQKRGGTFRFSGQIPPLPPVKPPMGSTALALFRPGLDAPRAGEESFTEVLERRRSIRRRGEAPLTAQQLGEFLFRCARVRRLQDAPEGELTDRPYPGAGARYELELYPVVHACEGVPAGLYHYCPLRHQLEPLAGVTEEVTALLSSTQLPQPPDVLFVIAARFQRVSWKYESTAYALILRDTGVLQQTMYLAATAMRLSPCAIGQGDPDLFCRVSGTGYYEESVVGEFALSGPPP